MLLDTLEKPKSRPPIITICGDSGLGKTSLACSFPKPVVIRAEDGLEAIPEEKRPPAFPLLKNAEPIWQQLKALRDEDHDYKTLVIDSVTSLERLFISYVIESDPKQPRSINQALGGYGAGLSAVANLHQRVRKATGILNQTKKMNIVFVAHADTETLELPDQDPYTRYSLRLGKKSLAPYVDESDLVGFLKLEAYTHGDGQRKKVVSTGSRVLVTYATASNISKNRYGITEDIPVKLGENPLIPYIKTLQPQKETPTQKPQQTKQAQQTKQVNQTK